MPATLPHLIAPVKERKSSEPVLSAAEQTRFSWARLVRSLEELPPAYHSFFAARPAGEPFPYAVLTPTFAGFIRRETEKLVCCLDDRLIILDKTSGEPRCTAFPLNALNYVEIGGVLLKAWIKLQGRANDETTLTTITLRYNAVTDRLFTPFIDRIRGTGGNPIEFPRDLETRQTGRCCFAILQVQELCAPQPPSRRSLYRRGEPDGDAASRHPARALDVSAYHRHGARAAPDRSRSDRHPR